MKQLFILRGLPGSGKSTWTRHKVEELHAVRVPVFVVEPDYWTDTFPPCLNRGRVELAEKECLRQFTEAILSDRFDVFVLNKFNVRTWEYTAYAQIAEAFGYDVTVVEFTPSLDTCLRRMSKRVYRNEVKRMYHTWDSTPERYEIVSIQTESAPALETEHVETPETVSPVPAVPARPDVPEPGEKGTANSAPPSP